MINQLVGLHENREHVGTKLANYQQKIKSLFDRKAKDQPLQSRDLVLQWDVRREEKVKNKNLMHFGSTLSKFHKGKEIIHTCLKI